MRNLSVSVHFARAVLRHCVNAGLDPVGLLRKNRISPRLLMEDDARISVERFADLQVSTMLAMQDETLGYAPRGMPIGAWSMMCHAVIGSATLGQGMSRFCRFFQLFDSGMTPVLEEHGETSRLRLQADPEYLRRGAYGSEMFLYNAHRFCSWLVQEHLPLLQVDLIGPAAARPAEYQQVFLRNPVYFDQPAASIVLATSLLEQPLQQNEASLRHYLRHPVLFMLTQNYARHSWTARVTDLLRQNIGELPELREVARCLDIHPQTLRRRLAAEGTSYKDIKTRLRRDISLYFLGKQGLSIEEIAHRSGFSESSAFIRAFKGWTGVTPYTYRKGL